MHGVHCESEQVHVGEGVVSDQSHTWCEIASVARMLRRVLCGHGAVDVGRAVGVLFNRNRNRQQLNESVDGASVSRGRAKAVLSTVVG